MKRYNVNKKSAARGFKNDVRTTKYANVRAAPMRGGIRL